MNRLTYLSLEECINLIKPPNLKPTHLLYTENHKILLHAKGSKTKHQAWPGGFIAHVEETMNIARVLYESLNGIRPLEFTLSDATLVLALHDIEKPWKQLGRYRLENDLGKKNHIAIDAFREQIYTVYGFQLSDEHRNALKYVEGEGHDYHPHVRIAGPLAAFCHMCDVWSARGWHDFPKKDGSDPWKKDKR